MMLPAQRPRSTKTRLHTTTHLFPIMKSLLQLRNLAAAALLALPALTTAQVLRSPIQYFRPYDQRGVNVFETPKQDSVAYEGFAVRLGASFKQGYQNIKHENYVGNVGITPVQTNQLIEQAGGFPLASANLNIDVQLAEGIRVSLVSYMASHHHNEFWVKGGYIQVDRVVFLPALDKLFEKYLTLKVGHMEVNYGDQHFRRTDNGQALWNPFMEGTIVDAFTTEIGGELYFQHAGFLAMVGATDGEIQGNVARPKDRSPSLYTKLGYDKQINDDLRLRITGSLVTTASSARNTLYAGDRTGSNYQFALEPSTATVTANFTGGRFNPGLTDKVTAFMINPFLKYRGFEFFGLFEQASGRSDAALEASQDREMTQLAADVIYRFGARENFYIGARYNTVTAELAPFASGSALIPTREVEINRYAVAAGWFITPAVLLKAEYVNQEYDNFVGPNQFVGYAGDIRNQGKFSGVVVQGVISF